MTNWHQIYPVNCAVDVASIDANSSLLRYFRWHWPCCQLSVRASESFLCVDHRPVDDHKHFSGPIRKLGIMLRVKRRPYDSICITFLPFISQVMCGAGCAFEVVQFANNFSPTVNCRLLNVIRGGPVCCAAEGGNTNFVSWMKWTRFNWWTGSDSLMTCICSTFDSFVKIGVSVDTSQWYGPAASKSMFFSWSCSSLEFFHYSVWHWVGTQKLLNQWMVDVHASVVTYVDFGSRNSEIPIRWSSIFDELEDLSRTIAQPCDLQIKSINRRSTPNRSQLRSPCTIFSMEHCVHSAASPMILYQHIF